MTATDIQTKPLSLEAYIGPLLVFGGAICIGFAPIGLRVGLDSFGPQAIGFWRFTFAIPMVLALVLLVHRRLPVRPNRFALAAGVFFALDIALWHWALTLTTVANATFIVNLGNISVGLLAWIFLKDRITAQWFLAAFIALIGAGLLTQGGGLDAKGDLRGDALAFGAAILVSGYMLCASIARRTLGGLDLLFWVTVTEAFVQLFIISFSGEAFLPSKPQGWLAPLFLAAIVQCGGQGLILAGLGRTPAGIAGVLVLMQPVTAAGLSWQLFEEPLKLLQLTGGVLILFGILLSQWQKNPKKLS